MPFGGATALRHGFKAYNTSLDAPAKATAKESVPAPDAGNIYQAIVAFIWYVVRIM